MKAVLCPVCNGVGKVSSGFYTRDGDCPYWVSNGTEQEPCRSCDGKGWLEVSEEYHSVDYSVPKSEGTAGYVISSDPAIP